MTSETRTSVLYKKDSKGKIRTWQGIVIDNGDDLATLSSLSGLEGGKLSGIPIQVKPMNVGRKNATTSHEQALSKMASNLTKKLKEGYVPNIAEFSQTGVMKALTYTKDNHRLPYIMLAGPKLDGVRMKTIRTETGVTLLSKQNNEFGDWLKRLPCVVEAANRMRPGEEVDGELYIHGWDLQDIKSAIVKDSRTRTEKECRGIIDNDCTDKLEYWVFDLPKQPETEIGAELRQAELLERFSGLEDFGLRVVESVEITKDDLEELNREYVSNGFEGTMLRNPAGLYSFGYRSEDLQKYKLFEEDEFPIVGTSIDRQGYGQFVCRSHAGHEFDVRPKGEAAFREYIAAHPEEFIGKLLTVRYQILLPVTLIPQFARGIAVRDYE